MLFLTVIGLSFAGPAIKQYSNLIPCDPKGTLRQVVEVERSKIKDTAFVFKKESFKRKRLNFQSTCDGKFKGTPFAFTYSSGRISGNVPLNECGHYGDAAKFGGYYDGMPLDFFFIAPPASRAKRLKKFNVKLFYRNMESETYNEFGNCTMKFIDGPAPVVNKPTEVKTVKPKVKLVDRPKKVAKKNPLKKINVKVAVKMSPTKTINKRLLSKGKKILKKKAKKAGYKRMKGNVKLVGRKCNILKNKCSAVVKATYYK